MKASSLHGIVRPPIGGLKPNSSSARLSKSWNEGWLKYDIGTTNLLFCISPTYTATCPLGTSGWFLPWRDFPLITCLTLLIMDGKRIPMFDFKLEWGIRENDLKSIVVVKVVQVLWSWKAGFESVFYRFFEEWTAILFQWRLSWVHVQRFGCFAILGIIGGPIATKAHMALLKAIKLLIKQGAVHWYATGNIFKLSKKIG